MQHVFPPGYNKMSSPSFPSSMCTVLGPPGTWLLQAARLPIERNAGRSGAPGEQCSQFPQRWPRRLTLHLVGRSTGSIITPVLGKLRARVPFDLLLRRERILHHDFTVLRISSTVDGALHIVNDPSRPYGPHVSVKTQTRMRWS